MKDHYKILGLSKKATKAQIKKAHRQLSLKYHPDKNGGEKAFTKMFKRVQTAYEVLSDESKRKSYDFQLTQQKKQIFNKHQQPDILYFRSDKGGFEYDKEITFSWKCINADIVNLEPFGRVSAQGKKTVRIKDLDNKKVVVKLVAKNTFLRTQLASIIALTNVTYQRLEEKIIRSYEIRKAKNPNQAPRQVPEGYISEMYFVRAIVAVIFFFVLVIVLMRALG